MIVFTRTLILPILLAMVIYSPQAAELPSSGNGNAQLEQNASTQREIKLKAAFTDEIATGFKAYKNKDYSAAFRKSLAPAIEGNAHAQYLIGDMYWNGYGVPKDGCLAHTWLEKSARQGHPIAAYLVTELYLGQGVKPNLNLAYRWALYTKQLQHPRGNDLVQYVQRFVPEDSRSSIERDMMSWDPSKLPPTEYFFYDSDALGSKEELEKLIQRTGVSACRHGIAFTPSYLKKK